MTDDLTVGAALIVGWLLGTVWTLTVFRAAARAIRDTPSSGAIGQPPDDPT